MVRKYPQLEVDLSILRSNARQVITHCQQQGIRVCGVVKGVDGLPEAARVLRAAGAAELGTSRLEQVAKCRAAGVPDGVIYWSAPTVKLLRRPEVSTRTRQAFCRRVGK